MKKYRLKISSKDFEELRRYVIENFPLEKGSFALAGFSSQGKTNDILIRRIIKIPEEMFRFQSEIRLEIHPQAINGLISLCENNNLCPVICHSHPNESDYSSSDDYGENRLFNTINNFLPSDYPLVSLLITKSSIKGRIWKHSEKKPIPISEFLIIGKTIQKVNKSKPEFNTNNELYNRQILALGTTGQKQIQQTKVGIIGVGGTGSAIAEQLIRLGVEDLKIIDKDFFEDSNLTRMYGSYQIKHGFWEILNRNGNRKVDLVKTHLHKIRPNTNVQAIYGNVVQYKIASELLDRDIMFLCTDEHWGRSIVNQISYQYLIPTINLGLRIDSKNGKICGAAGGIDLLTPEKPCLWCRKFLSPERIYTESLPKSKRKSLLREGYVENIDTPSPSVINLTTTLASIAVTQFMQITTNFIGSLPDRINYFILDNEISEGDFPTIDDKCICRKNKGFGDIKSLNTLINKY